MKRLLPYCLIALTAGTILAQDELQALPEELVTSIEELVPDSVSYIDSIEIIDPEVLFDSMPQPKVNYERLNLSFKPKVFAGYRKLHPTPEFKNIPPYYGMEIMTYIEEIDEDLENEVGFEENPEGMEVISVPVEEVIIMEVPESDSNLPDLMNQDKPSWLYNAQQLARAQEDLLYSYMIDNPLAIDYAYWDLPIPPVLIVDDDTSFISFLQKQEVPDVNPNDAVLPDVVVKKKHWLHKFGTLLQFSQAFVSPNWYQGGNNYLAMLFNFNWNVNLNQVYHPNLLFQSEFTYKLAISSNPSGYQHKYTISEDLLQYNLNAGLKAIKNWYYSLNLQFKTQLLNNYEQNSDVRTASFLSPGDLNIGLGMSYNHKNKHNTFQYTLTISPLSYNLKTCISDKVNHAAYNIPLDKKVKNEIGSNAELDLSWQITANISYKTKVFLFSDYHYFLGDWQNTLSFDINKFLSTQIFVHLRYDGSTENNSSWKKFMMREILSFGLSYTFSTKP